MSNRIVWPVQDVMLVASYILEKSAAPTGPWSPVIQIPNTQSDSNAVATYDSVLKRFTYTDTTGLSADWYRLTSVSGAGVHSYPSAPFQTAPPPALVSIALASFMSQTGLPEKGAIIIAVPFTQVINEQVLREGNTKCYTADEHGQLSIPLPQGAKLLVAIEGSALVRQITVPTSPTFDILQAVTDALDILSVQSPPEFLNRRSL